MQRPKMMQRSATVAELRGWRREEDEEKGDEGEKRNDPSVLFIRQETHVRRMNQATTNLGDGAVTSVIGDSLNKEDIVNVIFMMTSCRFTATREGDITAVQQLQEDVEDEDFLSRIDMNLFKSIWGLMLGILLLSVNRPICVGLTSSVVQRCKRPSMKIRPKACSRFRTYSRKPAWYVNLCCKLGIRRDQPGYGYEPVLGLCELVGVTRVYKGTTRRRFKDTDNNSRHRRSLFAPWSSKPHQFHHN